MPLRPGPAPGSVHLCSHPRPPKACLIPVLLPHPSHQKVPGTGELEAVDKAHLRRGKDNSEI